MVTIEEKNIKGLIDTLKGVMPANYEAMDRIVACVQYLECVLAEANKKQKEDAADG